MVRAVLDKMKNAGSFIYSIQPPAMRIV